MAARQRGRRARSGLLRRSLGVLVLAAAGVLYYQPLTAYLEKRSEVAVRAAEVEELQRERESLGRRLESQRSDATMVREARKLSYVRPGEQLFVVKGIAEWRRARAAEEEAEARLAGDG
jgi:cell division protein FtsB